MVRIIAKFWQFGGFFFLLVACGQTLPPPPTPLVMGNGLLPTPTLIAPPSDIPTVISDVLPTVEPVSPTAVAATSLPLIITATPVPSPTAVLQTSGQDSIGDPYIPELGNTGYDVQNYTLRLTIDPAKPYVQGHTTVTAVTTLEHLNRLSLDFIGFTVTQVGVNGQVATFDRTATKLWVNLPQSQDLNASLTIDIFYEGVPYSAQSPYVGFTSLGITVADEQHIYALGEPDGARYWFPSNDHPRDKALFRLEWTVPKGLTAVGNGRLLNTETTSTTSTFVWEQAHPMATYLALLAVAPYETIEANEANGLPLIYFVESADRAEMSRSAQEIEQALPWLEELLGPYPFESFGFVSADLTGIAFETQTRPIISMDMLGPKTAVHELIHMWFGDAVSLDSWGEMWRNEGFATYFALLWETRNQPEVLNQEMERIASATAENTPQYPLDNPPPAYLFGYNIYYKGALMAHSLRQRVGDDAFFGGLRLYFSRYAGQSASDAQFQAVMEEASGQSLSDFFAQWLP